MTKVHDIDSVHVAAMTEDIESNAQQRMPNHTRVPESEINTIKHECADRFLKPYLMGCLQKGMSHIPPTYDVPPFKPVYRLSPAENPEVQHHATEGLGRKIIEPSSSPYGAPVVFVRKKDGRVCMCVDNRALNKFTTKNKHPLPRIDGLLDQLHGASVFSSLDPQRGYRQVKINQMMCLRLHSDLLLVIISSECSAFFTHAPATLQAAMNSIFRQQLEKFVLVYLDDTLIFSKSPEEHAQQLRIALDILGRHDLYARLSKCEFNKPELQFPGHVVGRHGIRMCPAKTVVITGWPVLKDVHQLGSFLG